VTRRTIWSWAVMLLGALYFFVPLLATFEFSLRYRRGVYSFEAYRIVLGDPRFHATFLYSTVMALATIVVGVLLVATASLAAAAPAPAPAPTPTVRLRRFVLLAGVDDGGPTRTKLRYAATDARAMGRVLRTLGGVAPEDIVLVSTANRAAFDAAFADVEQRLRAGTTPGVRRELLVYYSGHSDEDGLLIGRDRVGYDELRARVQRAPADLRVVILDSCASGAFTRRKGGVKRAPFLMDASTDMRGHAFLTSSAADERARNRSAAIRQRAPPSITGLQRPRVAWSSKYATRPGRWSGISRPMHRSRGLPLNVTSARTGSRRRRRCRWPRACIGSTGTFITRGRGPRNSNTCWPRHTARAFPSSRRDRWRCRATIAWCCASMAVSNRCR